MKGAEKHPRFTFFGGKGGVGKTTCAAAAAIRAAAEGESVLVVSTDPAHSLGHALVQPLGPEPRPVRSAHGAIYAAELDADRALSRWLRAREDAIRTIADRGTYLDDEDIDRFLSLALPGVDELVGLVELVRLSRVREVDRVVVDTAPTGHTLRLLEMPDMLRRFAQVLDDMHAKHRFLASSLAGVWRPDFADRAIAEIEAEASSLRALLTSATRTSFTWVTLTEELPFRESVRGVAALDALGVDVSTIVINRVSPTSDPRWRRQTGDVFRERRVLELPAHVREPSGPRDLLELAMTVRHFGAPAPLATLPRRPSVRRSPSPPPDELLDASVRLVLVGGKGGVGKTTVASALALDLARRRPGARVLVLSTDPAHSLGDALATDLGDEERPVPGGPTNLLARELDAPKAWEAERARFRTAIEELFASIFRGKMDAAFDRAVLEDLLDFAPPGIDELLALVTILDALLPSGGKTRPAAAPFDVVVVDTAPTGHTLRLLALPEKALAWVHALMGIILKYRSVIGLGELASDLTQLARRLRALIALLSDAKRTAFVVVARAARLPRLETEALARELRRLRIPLSLLVVNAALASANEAREIARLRRAVRPAPWRVAPLVEPPPRRAAELEAWRARWVAGPKRDV